MSPSSSHSHSHSQDTSPYDQSCQSPTTASTYSFICAFLGSLSSISLPTHITGYFLPTLPQTILLWTIVLLGLIYSAPTTTLFFKILEESISEDYDSPHLVEYGTRGTETKRKRVEGKSKLRNLRGFSWAALITLGLLIGASIGLFLSSWRIDSQEWFEFCTQKALLVSTPSPSPSSSSSSSDSPHPESTSPKSEECSTMFLNQTYLVLGIPIILLTIELVRHFKTLAFVELASEQTIVEKDPDLELKWIREERGHAGGEHGGERRRGNWEG
ncbi:hypothetical protein JCM16303_000100 [Sporobolomyces ruberrimus]